MYITLYTQNYIMLICVYTCTHKYSQVLWENMLGGKLSTYLVCI